jgi:uncharacterized membrane protein YgcG
MNPHVPKSALAEEFKKDPEAAMRDYGAQPPLTNSPFISNKEKLTDCFNKKKNSLRITYQTVKSRDKTSTELYGELDTVGFGGSPSVLALDAGLTNNSFAFAIGHRSKKTGYPIVSLVGEVIPQPGARINFSLMYKALLLPLAQERNVVLVCADRWNSAKVLSDMEQDLGVQQATYSLKYNDMQLFKSYREDKQVLLPLPTMPVEEILKYDHAEYPQCFKHRPMDHLVLQLLTVQDTGASVIKGDQLTDDIARATFLCFNQILDPDNDELLSQADEEESTLMDLRQMVVSRHYSGGGSGGNNGGGMGSGGGGGSSAGYMRQRQG